MSMQSLDSFKCRKSMKVGNKTYHYFNLKAAEKNGLPGGLNTTGVAPYKYFVGDSLEEARFIESLGVEIRTGVEGRDAQAVPRYSKAFSSRV